MQFKYGLSCELYLEQGFEALKLSTKVMIGLVFIFKK